MAESFFATLECELINLRSWKTKAGARNALFRWIEGSYNPRRRHSGLNDQPPTNCETTHHNTAVADAYGLPTGSVGSSQATTDAVDQTAPDSSEAPSIARMEP